ncbi:methyltransferase domain-containing protein [Spirulina sp. CCNP1310]|uniref:methyltransferase domain-containing protein n=1 Tax=Spirulina sp. CCNP1310 TaxID=3110249 RepID=UPI002B1EFCFF|nr:methyltransferase domain-containing protein [Spirulina sp. CCNP1310]MEA5419015.1 methyltransferase domain-containing protein [Spirulina sp. CCNP1310]
MTTALSEQIRRFYDTTSGLWEAVWGEHMHHGYYGRSGLCRGDRRQAQIDLIEELLYWGNVQNPQNILDVGCGIGGSTLYLAQKYQAKATGITLSPIQAGRAKERAREAGLAPQAQFQVADALAMPFADQSFDLVWSLESGEHMPDKEQFLRECYRVLKPGGKFLMATWCHRPTDRFPLTAQERGLLAEIYRVYHLPYVLALPDYWQMAQDLGLKNLRCEDWSTAVAPFWDVVIDSALAWQAVTGLMQLGGEAISAALGLRLMVQGYDQGLIRFGLICGQR